MTRTHRDCPVCGEPLAGVGFRDVELDLCYVCRGIWLGLDEVDRLLGKTPRAEELRISRRGYPHTAEKSRACPDCGAVMQKFTLGLDSPVVVDHCPQGHGEWFDRGELTSLLEQGGMDLSHLMLQLLEKLVTKAPEEE